MFSLVKRRAEGMGIMGSFGGQGEAFTGVLGVGVPEGRRGGEGVPLDLYKPDPF